MSHITEKKSTVSVEVGRWPNEFPVRQRHVSRYLHCYNFSYPTRQCQDLLTRWPHKYVFEYFMKSHCSFVDLTVIKCMNSQGPFQGLHVYFFPHQRHYKECKSPHRFLQGEALCFPYFFLRLVLPVSLLPFRTESTSVQLLTA